MPVRQANLILDDIVQSRGRGAPIHRKLALNRERNWLLGLTLNSFTRFSDNEKLTGLERSIVDAFKKNGFSNAEIKQFGATAKRMPQAVRDEFFPDRFSRIQAISRADIRQDAPAITQRILAQPNVTNLDIPSIHTGNRTLRDFRTVTRATARDFSSELLLAVEPAAPGAPPAAASPRYRIKATKFKCIDRQTDSFFGPSDEIYWIFGSLGDGAAVTTRTGVFGDVDNGETRTFSDTDGCIWGQDCTPQQFPDGEVGTLLQLWEHDSSNPEDIRKGVAAAFAAAAGILAASGVAAWVGAVVAGVGAVLQWILGFLDDDHIADQTIVYTRQMLDSQIAKSGAAITSRRFSDGDGDFLLTIGMTRLG
ncbi:hypothetical protein OG809_33625 [Kribbella soli]